MVGWLRWKNLGRFQVSGEKIQIFKLPLFQVSLNPQGKLFPLRLKYANELFLEQKSHQVIAPPDFPHWDKLPQLSPYNPLPSLQSLGGDLLLHQLDTAQFPRKTASVLLVSDKITPPVYQSALTLAPHVKELIFSLPPHKLNHSGLSQIHGALFEQFGLAPCYHRDKPTAKIDFISPLEALEPHPFHLSLSSLNTTSFSSISIKDFIFPPDLPPLPLLALLLQTERFHKKDFVFS